MSCCFHLLNAIPWPNLCLSCLDGKFCNPEVATCIKFCYVLDVVIVVMTDAAFIEMEVSYFLRFKEIDSVNSVKIVPVVSQVIC